MKFDVGSFCFGMSSAGILFLILGWIEKKLNKKNEEKRFEQFYAGFVEECKKQHVMLVVKEGGQAEAPTKDLH